MATQTIVQVIDDITGEIIDDGLGQTIEFGLDGTAYEIDLSNENAEKLRDALAEFVAAARKAAPARKTRGTAPKTSNEVQEARAWLKANGYPVKDKGRIVPDLMDVWRQNKDLPPVEDEPVEEIEDGDDTPAEAPELDTSDQAVIAWHENRGMKVNSRMMGLMRSRYLKAHNMAS